MKFKITLGLIIVSNIFINSCSNNVKPAQDIKINANPAMLERGKYLVHNVSLCIDCHSKHSEEIFGRPPVAGTEGQGGELFGKEAGFPGNIYAKNITPAALGNWTDGEIVRSIAEGVSKDGTALFPIMPYNNYGKMSQEDIYAIVAYIRTLKPITSDIPPRKLDFPLNFIVKTMPQPANYQPVPDKKNHVEYGKYVANSAGCVLCHTQMVKGTPVKDMDYAGGEKFPLGGKGTVYSANITPDKETGIGEWTKEHFVKRFKDYEPNIKLKEKEMQTVMPWPYYKNMTEEDLGAVYEYLKTLKPIKNKVQKWEPAS